jgi:hypothetical protein
MTVNVMQIYELTKFTFVYVHTYALTSICVSDDGHTKGGNM